MNDIQIQETVAAIDVVMGDYGNCNDCECTETVLCVRCLWDDLKRSLEDPETQLK